MVQLSGGGGDSADEEASSEVDDATNRAFRRGGRGSLAEPEIEAETERMAQAQDQDLQEVQRREQQAAEADSSPQPAARGRTRSPAASPSPEPATQNLSPSGTSATVDSGGQTQPSPPDPGPVDAPDASVAEPEPVEADTADAPAQGTASGQDRTFTAEEVTEAAKTRLKEGTAGATTERAAQQAANQAAPQQTEDLRRQAAKQAGVDPSGVDVVKIDDRLVARLNESGEAAFAADIRERRAQQGNAIDVEAAKAVSQAERPVATTSVEGGAVDVEAVERFAGQRTDVSAARSRPTGAQQTRVSRNIERRFEEQIEAETGRDVDLDPQDIEFVTEDGERRAELAQSGIDKVATAPLTGALENEDIGFRGFEITPGPFAGAFPGAGLIGAGVEVTEKEPLGPVVKDVGVTQDFGNIDLQVAQFGDRAIVPGRGAGRRERVGTKDFETVLSELDEDVATAVEVQAPAVETGDVQPGRAGSALRTERRAFTGTGQEAVAAFGESTIESVPRFAIGAAQLGKDVADFTVKTGETEIQELDTLFTSAGQVGINTAGVGISEAIEAPGVTAGRAAGTLVGSAGIFAGAAAIGPRSSLAARAAIQPGEELAGIGGFAATKRVAGRGTAQRFFPNREPLVFSEEAFIRGVRGASRRVSTRLEAADFESRFTDVDVKQSTIDAIEAAKLEMFRRRTRPRPLEMGPEEIQLSPRRARELGLLEVEFGPFDTEFEVDVEAEGTEPSDVGPGAEGGISSGGGFELDVEQRTDSGVVVERARIRPSEVGIEARTEAEFETARTEPAFESRRRFETATEFDPIGQVGVEPIEAPGVEPLQGTEAFTRFDQPFGEVGRFDMFQELEAPGGLELELEQEFEGEQEFAREFETEREAELALEQELEQEQELELEQEFEQEFRELELEGGAKEPRDFPEEMVEEEEETFERFTDFLRTEDPFGEIEADLDAVDAELNDLD